MPTIQKTQELFSGLFYLKKKKDFHSKNKMKVFIMSEYKQH